MKIKKGRIETIIIFLLSPLLSLPLIGLQLKRKDNFAIGLISIFIGLLSFNYVPHISDDKARYYERYNDFLRLNWSEFIKYLGDAKRPDFVFETLIYIFAKLGINVQFLFLIITTFTVYSIFLFIKKTIETQVKNTYYFEIGLIMLILFSFSMGDLFSGIRFYFATSIFIWGLYYLFFYKNIKKGIVFLILSIATHFSLAFFIPAILICFFYLKKTSPKWMLLVSLLFLFLPKDFLSALFGIVQVSEAYSNKAAAYLAGDREFSQNLIILNNIRNLWIYFSYGYLLLRKGDSSKLYILIVLFTAVVNVTYSVPLIFNRYTILLKILFMTFYLMLWYKKQMSLKILLIIGLLFFLNFVVDINVYRNNLLESYSVTDMLTIVNFLSKKIDPNDFLY